ncbi:hypothetical protein DSM104299_03225 [Baekduia alba]|nr:hypothetical protein DSM104299_03225 [Baekduia alba]
MARGRPASDRAIGTARRRYSEVKDTKGDSDRLSEKDRQKIVSSAMDKIAEHVVKNQRFEGHGPEGGYTPDHPLVKNLVRAGRIKVFSGGLGTGDAYGSAGPVGAGVLKVLDFTARPGHAIAGAADALVEGKGAGAAHHAATRGIEGKDRALFSDVLKHAGAPKAVQGVGGFALDVAADPTTYVTFGAGGVASHAAEKAAADTAKRAAAAGFGEEAAKTAAREAVRAAKKAGKSADEAASAGREAARRAREQAVRQVTERAAKRATVAAPKGSGATVRFGGREVPGVRRGSAAVGRGAGKVAGAAGRAPGAGRVAARGQQAAGGARELVREVRPTIAPAGVDSQAFEGARRAARQARAATNHADRENQAFARALHKDIGAANYEKVIRAIETRTVSKLPAELHSAAVVLRSRFRHAKTVRKHAGLGEGTIRDYFPHARQDVLEQGLGISDQAVEGVQARRGAGGRTVTRPGSAATRSDRRGIHEINPERVAEGKEPFSTNVPLVALNYLTETARTAAKSDFLKAMAKTGRAVKPGQGTLHLKDGEAVYRLGFEPGSKTSTHLADSKAGGEVVLRSGAGRGRFGLREVDESELQRVLGHKPGDAGAPQGQYVVLDRGVVEDTLASTQPARAKHKSGQLVDKATGGFKRVATATPGFHVRNAIGDAQMGFLGQPGGSLVRNTGQASKALRRVSEQEREAGKVRVTPKKSASTIKVAGQRMPLDDFLAGAKKHGVIRSGYVGRELEDLTKGKVGAPSKVKRGTGDRVKRWMQNREDLFRIATYKHGLDKGLPEAEAADLAASIHIDYGDLTETERRYLRRALPFYTFSARALPLHAKKLITNPGKYATIEKAREEVGKSTGLSEDEQRSRMQLYQQRQAPFVIKIGGRIVAVSAQLPLTLLNEVPTSTNLSDYLDELGQFTAGLLNPIVKDPAEMWANESAFFRRPIEDERRPLVAAPSWVQHVPKKYWAGLGITPDYVDKRTGKKTWGWRGKADYVAKAIPGPASLVQQLASPGTNRRGQGETAKLVAGLSGVRLDPLDENAAASTEVTNAYKELALLNRRAGALNQQGVNGDHPTHEYFVIRQRIKALDFQVEKLQRAQQGPPKPVDRETEMLLQEAHQAQPKVSDRERDMLLREARLAAAG